MKKNILIGVFFITLMLLIPFTVIAHPLNINSSQGQIMTTTSDEGIVELTEHQLNLLYDFFTEIEEDYPDLCNSPVQALTNSIIEQDDDIYIFDSDKFGNELEPNSDAIGVSRFWFFWRGNNLRSGTMYAYSIQAPSGTIEREHKTSAFWPFYIWDIYTSDSKSIQVLRDRYPRFLKCSKIWCGDIGGAVWPELNAHGNIVCAVGSRSRNDDVNKPTNPNFSRSIDHFPFLKVLQNNPNLFLIITYILKL